MVDDGRVDDVMIERKADRIGGDHELFLYSIATAIISYIKLRATEIRHLLLLSTSKEQLPKFEGGAIVTSTRDYSKRLDTKDSL